MPGCLLSTAVSCISKIKKMDRGQLATLHVFMPMLLAPHMSQDAPIPELVGMLLGLSIIPVLVFVPSSCAQLLQSHTLFKTAQWSVVQCTCHIWQSAQQQFQQQTDILFHTRFACNFRHNRRAWNCNFLSRAQSFCSCCHGLTSSFQSQNVYFYSETSSVHWKSKQRNVWGQ